MSGAFLCALLLVGGDDQAQIDKTKLDRTGIQWVMPFKEALAKAKRENRLVMMKMIAGGSTRSGCW